MTSSQTTIQTVEIRCGNPHKRFPLYPCKAKLWEGTPLQREQLKDVPVYCWRCHDTATSVLQ